MNSLNNRVSSEKRIFQNAKMDYRQNISNAQKLKNDDDDDEDLETLRLAALKSLRVKNNLQSTKTSQSVKPRVAYPLGNVYNNRGNSKRGFYQNRPPRQNGNVYYHSRVNQNLIEIVPMEDDSPKDATQSDFKILKSETQENKNNEGDSKFYRYKDTASGSEEEETKESNLASSVLPKMDNPEKIVPEFNESETERNNQNNLKESQRDPEEETIEDEEEEEEDDDEEEEEEEKPSNDDDDDVLLMADLEEEDSLERLMDEMEREMNVEKPSERKEKKMQKKDSRESRKLDISKVRNRKSRNEREEKNGNTEQLSTSTSLPLMRNERRSVSPRSLSRTLQKRRSLSPKPKLRKKSPRRSPRRSPSRQSKKIRQRSPRKLSPSRFSPKLSPRLSPSRRSPNSSLRKLSPRGRSNSRSPRIRRSRSPIHARSRSPKRSNRSRSPRIIRSPRNSPPRSRTPRSKSPRNSPLRRRSPRLSPRRNSPIRILSPHRSPWSSPRNSPRLSPRRRRSPKESRKIRQRSITPEEIYKRDSPVKTSPDNVRKSKREVNAKEIEINNDPILEARRRKFECNKPIDPVQNNKKIKLSKKDNTNKKIDITENNESPKLRKSSTKNLDDYEENAESDLCLTDDYISEVLEDVVSDDDETQTNTVSMCVEMIPVKVEKERSKKKKKRDKEIYQVGKLKGGDQLPLSERIGKEKKCKKRKDKANSPESSPEQTTTVVEDLTVDEEGDLRTELSRRRAERLNRAVPIQSARLLQSAFKGVVNEVAKTNAKVNQRHAAKGEDKSNKKEVRRVTVLHRAVTDLPDSEEEAVVDSKVPVRFRLGINKPSQESREPKAARKSSKRQGRKVKHKNNMPLTDHDRKNQ